MPPADSRPFRYEEHPPAPDDAPLVQCYWAFTAALAVGESLPHHVWPDGCVSVAVVCPPGVGPVPTVVPPTTVPRRLTMTGPSHVVGVRLHPHAGGAALERPAATLRTAAAAPLPDAACVDLTAFAAERGAAAAAAALGPWVRARRARGVALDALVARAVATITASGGERPIRTVAAEVGIGVRQLERRFRAAVGLTPKEYARVRRLRVALEAALASDAPWGTVAHAVGFADQAHLVRELSRLTGFTPGEMRAHLARIEHVGVGRH